VCRFNPSPRAMHAAVTGPERSEGKEIQEARQRFVVYPVGDMAATNSVNVLFEDRAGYL